MKKISLLKSGLSTSIFAGILASVLFPVLTFAEAFKDVKGIVNDGGAIITGVYKLMFVVALVFFMWNMSQVILKSGDAKAKEEARNKMIWGIIAIFIMFSIYGIVRWIGGNLNVDVGGSSISVVTP